MLLTILFNNIITLVNMSILFQHLPILFEVFISPIAPEVCFRLLLLFQLMCLLLTALSEKKCRSKRKEKKDRDIYMRFSGFIFLNLIEQRDYHLRT